MPADSSALFTIQRDAGAFTAVTVSWEVTTAGSGMDISTTEGTVEFGEGQMSGDFEIQALPDEVSRAARSYNTYSVIDIVDQEILSLIIFRWYLHHPGQKLKHFFF